MIFARFRGPAVPQDCERLSYLGRYVLAETARLC